MYTRAAFRPIHFWVNDFRIYHFHWKLLWCIKINHVTFYGIYAVLCSINSQLASIPQLLIIFHQVNLLSEILITKPITPATGVWRHNTRNKWEISLSPLAIIPPICTEREISKIRTWGLTPLWSGRLNNVRMSGSTLRQSAILRRAIKRLVVKYPK